MQKDPDATMRDAVVDSRVAKNPIKGGASDTDVKDPTVIPTGRASSNAVTTTTPVGYDPKTRRTCVLETLATHYIIHNAS